MKDNLALENVTNPHNIEMNNLDIINYRAIELLERLNCPAPPEWLIYKAESLLKGIFGEEKHAMQHSSY